MIEIYLTLEQKCGKSVKIILVRLKKYLNADEQSILGINFFYFVASI